MGVRFTITKVTDMLSANILGALPSGSPPEGGKSLITITETTSDGSVMAPATYTVVGPANTFSFTAGVGSKLDASQVDVSAAGFQSPPTVTPTFLVANPAPPAPGGPIQFSVVSINP